MLKNVVIVNKNKGETPLDCIEKLKNSDPKLRNIPITYAGRLDPLAEGVLVLLLGDECHKKDEYLKLNKVYEVEILLGFTTDTYDVMGMVKNTVASSELLFKRSSFEEAWEKIIKQFTGRIKQSYPPYSSRTVNGKPLFMWAREDKLNEIEIPSHDVFIESIDLIGENTINGEKLLEKIKNDISLVKGDFRQAEIINIWNDTLKEKKEENYKTITLRISCGSGVYVRGVAHELGISLGIPALALKIKRTKVGEYHI